MSAVATIKILSNAGISTETLQVVLAKITVAAKFDGASYYYPRDISKAVKAFAKKAA